LLKPEHWEKNSQTNEERQMTTDPVCGMRVDDKNPEFQTQFAGKKYFFCSDECRKEFEERPEEYVETAA
jgi:YHS domain-containing protein